VCACVRACVRACVGVRACVCMTFLDKDAFVCRCNVVLVVKLIDRLSHSFASSLNAIYV